MKNYKFQENLPRTRRLRNTILYEVNPVDAFQTHFFNTYFERIMFIVKQNVTFSTIALYSYYLE